MAATMLWKPALFGKKTQSQYLAATSNFELKLTGRIGGKNGWVKLAGKNTVCG